LAIVNAMTTSTLIPIILAGGKGERFWPLSRRQRPKQFLSLDGSGVSLLQGTAQRLLSATTGWDNLWVVTNSAIAPVLRDQLPHLPEANLLVEPMGKDTAPALAWSTLEAVKRYGKDAILGFFPADHWIPDQNRFQQTLQAATELAATQDAIVTLGIHPSRPATGYGYIEQGESVGDFQGLPAYKVNRFTEKPDHNTATQFLNTGRYSWNSGMFIFRAEVVLNELQTYAPEILQPLQAKGESAYRELTKKSIDYALMEQTQLAYVIPADFGWDDVGDWNALSRLHPATDSNIELGTHISQDTHNSIIYTSNDDEVVVTIGLEDVVIVRDGKATLVVHKDRTQDIKKVLKQIQNDPQLENFL
jgi:mannose-1-phosphate guanylyltransferase